MNTRDVVRRLTSGPGFIDTISNLIIRPPRSNYEISDLGPATFCFGAEGKQRYVRKDMELMNMRGMTIQCSWYKPAGSPQRRPCVVYCHANCGGRYDAHEALYVLEHGFTLFTFDFCGSGMSDGHYISLGVYERQDLADVIDFLHSRPEEVNGIALMGRSMGAVTAIMYAAKDPSIRAIVCDSPFASLHILIQDLVAVHGSKYIPNILVNSIVDRVRKRIAYRACFNIDDLNTIKYARQCRVPAIIFHGQDDDFVFPRNSMAVNNAFKGQCIYQLVDGGHNDERTPEMQNMIVAFLKLYLVEKARPQRMDSKGEVSGDTSSEKMPVNCRKSSSLSSTTGTPSVDDLCQLQGVMSSSSFTNTEDVTNGIPCQPHAQAFPISFTKPRLSSVPADDTDEL